MNYLYGLGLACLVIALIRIVKHVRKRKRTDYDYYESR